MLKWALFFLALAIVAALAQTAGVDALGLAAARVLCIAALALFVFCVGVGGTRRRT